MSKVVSKEDFFKRIENMYGEDHYDYSLVNFVNMKTKVTVICNVHKIKFEISPKMHSRGRGCRLCGHERSLQSRMLDNVTFISRAIEIHKGKYNYSLTNFIKSTSKVIIICPIHGNFEQEANSHLRGIGCNRCGVESMVKLRSYDIKIFVDKANKKHKHRYDYSKFIYTNSNNKGQIVCKLHGEYEQTPNNHLQGQGCPVCRLSKGSLKVKDWLDDHNIKYEIEKRFDACKNKRSLPFDFYLPEHNTCIEFDGKQHYKIIHRSKDKNKNIETFISNVINDQTKNEFCKNNNITLIRIPYWESDLKEFLCVIQV